MSRSGFLPAHFISGAISMKRLVSFLALSLLVLGGLCAQASGLSLGLGHSSVFRVGPGKDDTGTQVYSFTYVYSAVIFDAAGKIVDVEVDELEVATPNYDGASMPHFTGWPGTPGYNVFDHSAKKVNGLSPNTVDSVTADVTGWKSKRDRGDSYGMNAKNDWWKQIDFYQNMFIGKTMDEVEAWYKKYTSDTNGKPLNPETKIASEKAKYDALSDADKKVVADVRSGATMSINDAHGYVLQALRNAWNNRKPVTT
jgi:hypothetical protein